jgi:hypothetical protein
METTTWCGSTRRARLHESPCRLRPGLAQRSCWSNGVPQRCSGHGWCDIYGALGEVAFLLGCAEHQGDRGGEAGGLEVDMRHGDFSLKL